MGYNRVLCFPRSGRMGTRGPGCAPIEVCHCATSRAGGGGWGSPAGRGAAARAPCPPPAPAPDSLDGPQSQDLRAGVGGGSGCSLRIFRLPATCGSGTGWGEWKAELWRPLGRRLLAALSCDRAGDAPNRGQSHVPSGLPVSSFWAPGRQPQLGSGGLDDARERRGGPGNPSGLRRVVGIGGHAPLLTHVGLQAPIRRGLWLPRKASPGLRP